MNTRCGTISLSDKSVLYRYAKDAEIKEVGNDQRSPFR